MNKFKGKEKEFLQPVLYPQQFTTLREFAIHLVNVVRPLYIEQGSEFVKMKCCKILDKVRKQFEHLRFDPRESMLIVKSIWMEHNPNDYTLYNWKCYEHLHNVLTEQDYNYWKSNKAHSIKLMEFKFIAQKMTYLLSSNKFLPCLFTNKYIFSAQKQYFRYTERKLNKNKLAHILTVLEKHNYFHSELNNKGQRIIQINSANPYYQLSEVPECCSLQTETNIERKLKTLMQENAALKRVVEERDDYIQELEFKLQDLKDTIGATVEIAVKASVCSQVKSL